MLIGTDVGTPIGAVARTYRNKSREIRSCKGVRLRALAVLKMKGSRNLGFRAYRVERSIGLKGFWI